MTIDRMIELLSIEQKLRSKNDEIEEMYTEVIDLLNRQNVRILTLEELLPFPASDVWLEYKGECCLANAISIDETDKDVKFAWYWHHNLNGNSGFILNGLYKTEYGRKWRCWTNKPTKEQMEELK